MKKTDIAIVGAGLVGAVAAIALNRIGISSVLIDKMPWPKFDLSFDTRSLALAEGSRVILESLDIWPHLAEHAVEVQHVHVSDKGGFGFTRIDAEAENLRALGYVIPFPKMLEGLKRCLEELSIDVIRPAEITNIVTTSAGVELQYGDEALSASLLLAADGAQSMIRDQLFIGTKEVAYDQTAIVGNIGLKRAHDFVAYERFTQHGPLAILPLEGLRAGFVWPMPTDRAEQLMALDGDDFLAELQQMFGYRLGRFVRCGERKCYPLKMIKADKQYADHILLLGNAVHNLHPVAGQGFNLSLRDVADLIDVFDARSDCALNDPALIQEYLDLRQGDQARTIRVTDSFVKAFSNDLLPAKLGRNLGLRFLERVPPAKTALNNVMMGRSGRLSRLARGVKV